MHHSFLDRYSDLDSCLHRLDARVKIIGVFIMLLFIVAEPNNRFLIKLIGAAILLALWFAAHIPFTYLLKRLGVAIPFVIFISAGILWSKYVEIGNAALIFSASIILKAFLSITAISLLTSTTPFPVLLKALGKLRVPLIILNLLSFFYRFAYILVDEFERLDIGRKSREFRRNLKMAWRGRSWMIGSSLIRSIERSERVYQAMLARGYSGADQ